MIENIERKRPILLKKVLDHSGIKPAAFAETFTKETGLRLSRTSCINMLDYGRELKRAAGFKEVVINHVAENYPKALKAAKVEAEAIWNIDPSVEETATDEDLFTKKLKELMEATMITKETMRHFGLKTSPFTLDIRKESDIYLSESHAYALSVIKEAAEYGGFAVVTGQVGSGKSTVLSKFLEENRIAEKYQIIFPEAIDKTKVNAKQILQACVFDMSSETPKGGMEALSRQVKNLLVKKCDNKERTVLIIEEAHDLPVNTLKYLKRLWEMKTGLQRLMGIILIGQNELETRLYGKANSEIREVTARTTHARVEPIQKEISEYIAHRARQAGGDINKIISRDAVEELAERLTIEDRNGKKQSAAYPLTVNNLMNRLMNEAYLQGEEIITKELVINAGV